MDSTIIRIKIIRDLFKALYKRKLWWTLPIVFFLLFFMLLIAFAGHTGIAILIYPLF